MLRVMLLLLLSSVIQPALASVTTRQSSSSNTEPSTYTGPFLSATSPGIWSKGYTLALPLLQNMTLSEKVSVITGTDGPCVGTTAAIPRLNLRGMCLQDGPLGVRPVRRTSQFPAGVTVAATWDRELFAERGRAMAREFKGKGISMMLSPVAGSGPLGRSPLGGRNAEGFGQDEYLGGEAAYHTVKAAQSEGMMTCSKHFLAYEQETYRQPYNQIESSTWSLPPGSSLPISSLVDSKTTHELYLWGFAEAVRAGTASVMSSYNRVNGTHASQDAYLLSELLKGELGFKGSVVSDWGGLWTTADAALAGNDISMPGIVGINGRFFGPALEDAVNNGTVPIERVDDMVMRTLSPWLTLQDLSTWPLPTFDMRNNSMPTNNVREDHWRIINKIGEESITLLKNNRSTGGGLPLKSIHDLPSLLIAGTDAGPTPQGQSSCGATGCAPGTPGILTSIGGSGWSIPPYVIDPQGAIQRYVREGGVDINLALNDFDLGNVASQAAASHSSLVFVSAFAAEGADRANLSLSNNGEELIRTVTSNCNDTTVIIHAPGAVLMEEWIDNPNVTAVLFAYYPGQEGGEMLPPILWGEKSPSGKLPFVIGKRLEDWPPGGIMTDRIKDPEVNFAEGKLVDWKWLQAHNITERFAFGHGLSYSTFHWADLVYIDGYEQDSTSIHRTNERFQGGGEYDSLYDVIGTAYVDVTNTGPIRAAEVAQLYVSFPVEEAAGQPPCLLRGFDKLWLQPGETKRASFPLRRKDVSLFDVGTNEWRLPSGEFTLSVGSSSASIHSDTKKNFL